MKTLTILLFATLFGIEISFAEDAQILAQIRKEITSLKGGAGDVWDYSGSGGYVFRFYQDVLGDDSPETFLNVSIRPNVWHIFANGDSKSYIGDIELRGAGFLMRRDSRSVTLLDTYQADALHKYIIEQKITAKGVQKSARKVGDKATESEYQAVLTRQTSENITWVVPKMDGVLLHDFLTHSSPKWFEFNPDKAQVKNGYYRLLNDESRIGEFENVFTPKVALKLLTQKLDILQKIKTAAAALLNNGVQSTPLPTMSTPAPMKESAP